MNLGRFRISLLIAVALTAVCPVAWAQGANPMKIRIDVDGAVMLATLEDSAAARDFASLLPLDLKLDDYHATEKIAYLSRKLSIEGALAAIDPEVGDIAYYAPWGNLAIFYKDFGHSPGLVRLGRIQSGGEAMNRPGSLKATIRRAD